MCRDGCTVDLYKRLIVSVTVSVDFIRDDFFTCTGFTGNQNGGIRWCYMTDQRPDIGKGSVFAIISSFKDFSDSAQEFCGFIS